ncbi:MAG: hypothetical protein IT256_08135 [Chitinophagaceae bacterium]|nr:hypothetical protein [Chitinophagaceae bacterium]
MQKLLVVLAFILFSFAGVDTLAQGKTKKETKTEKPAGGKLKSDGTPDMRYKENKNAKAAPTKHLKKDGTADKRYKENKK